VVGAPFIDPHVLTRELASHDHPGLTLRPVRFVPTFDKWQGQACGGIALHIVDPKQVRPVRFTVDLLSTVCRLYPDHFAWLPPPYEYERDKPPIDILYGSARLREALQGPGEPEVSELSAVDALAWWERVREFRIYE
jgi:uncharacterized protein YbbC (DUF1343 family)